MSFRARLLIVFSIAVLVPLIAFTYFVRAEMTRRLTTQYEHRVESVVAGIEEDVTQQAAAIAASLAILRDRMEADNRFRRAAVDHVLEERRYLLDYAGNAMQLSGLSMLQIQDEAGRILSSGHFRNEYDRLEPALPRLLAATKTGTALVRVRAPDEPFVALARVDSVTIGARRFTLVAGVEVDERFLSRLERKGEVGVSLVGPGGVLASGAGESPSDDRAEKNAIVREWNVPFIDARQGELSVATFRVSHRLDELEALRSSVNRWFGLAVVAAAALAIALVGWFASRISRPLVELADKTSRIDLDRLDIDFGTGRNDEIGALSRLLGAMTGRLRASALRIKDAERRATVGELARQVNHDIKNGLTPIRNVIRHLTQVARDHPAELPEVFAERQGTLDSSVSYLDGLATRYARLHPPSDKKPVDVNAVVRRVVLDREGREALDLQTRLCDNAVVAGDPVSLRRVVENVVTNAIDSLPGSRGRVVVTTSITAGEDGGPRVRITVADNGVGMSDEQRAKIFDDFYTTKDEGTGLGLSIVRRLVMDLDGTVVVESAEGKGTRFTIELPGVSA